MNNPDPDKISKAYQQLVGNKKIESGKLEVFIKSLSGQRFISPVRWEDGSALARFITGLKVAKLSDDILNRKGRILWTDKIYVVFPRSMKNVIFSNIHRSLGSDPYDGSKMEDVIALLK